VTKLEITYLPSGKTSRVPAGTTAFNAAHWAGLPIESTCGGRGTCGKCKVRVLEGGHEPTPADHRKLDLGELEDGWRLSCQLELEADAVCEVPNLQSTPKAATMGVGRFVLLEPNVQRVTVAVGPPSLEDGRSHLRRLLDARKVQFESGPFSRSAFDLNVPRTLLDDPKTGRQPQARPFAGRFGCEERLKEVRLDLIGHSYPGVGETQHNVLSCA